MVNNLLKKKNTYSTFDQNSQNMYLHELIFSRSAVNIVMVCMNTNHKSARHLT